MRAGLLPLLALGALLLSGCAREDGGAGSTEVNAVEAAAERAFNAMRLRADSIDALFQPLPLLRPAEEAALRRYGNDRQLAAARRLGVPPNTGQAQLSELVRAGRLVRLADSTALWSVRTLDHSAPYLTLDAEARLRDIAERFQRELARMGAPAFRLEVTSALRSAEDQAALRRVNPNAAAGASTHQYGAAFDLAYSAFAAPAAPAADATRDLGWLEPHAEWVEATLAEKVAARRSRELMAVLGRVLIRMQEEGSVMVTLERLQPVFHVTVAAPAADGS